MTQTIAPFDLPTFYRACNPSKTIDISNADDRPYYIDFSPVRGSDIIEELQANISLFSPDVPTCQLFAGHIGCGKSTELLRLKAALENDGFHVVYFESSRDLDMADVDVGDILLAIAHQVSENLDAIGLELQPTGLKAILQGATAWLRSEVDVEVAANIPGVGEVGVSKDGFSLGLGIGKLTAKTKNSPKLRSKLRQYLEPRVTGILSAINDELLAPAIAALQQRGKKGLVVIIDNLDRLDSVAKPWGRLQPEYLFVDRGEQLRNLNCHVVYTIPLGLVFSNDLGRLVMRFGVDPKVLPMIPVSRRDGTTDEEGMKLLRQMVLVRAFPGGDSMDSLDAVFDSIESLDRLCCVSGGHPRNLLKLLHRWIEKERKLPLSRHSLEAVIKERRNQLTLPIDDREWKLLRKVAANKRVNGQEDYQTLVRSTFVFEYRDEEGSWFDINPILGNG